MKEATEKCREAEHIAKQGSRAVAALKEQHHEKHQPPERMHEEHMRGKSKETR